MKVIEDALNDLNVDVTNLFYKGLDQIEHPELKKNLQQLRLNLIDYVNVHGKSTTLLSEINSLIYNYVIGIGVPITICDGRCYEEYVDKGDYYVEIMVDYKVTSGYKPYQILDKPIHLSFSINQQIIRDLKLEKILLSL